MQAHSIDSGWIMYCRAGFEAECAREALDLALPQATGSSLLAEHGTGFARVQTPDAALPHPAEGALVFARQALSLLGDCTGLSRADRLGPALELAGASGRRYADVWVETPDAPSAADWAALARSLGPAARSALRTRGLYDPASGQRLHLLLLDGETLVVAIADVARASAWPRGIPRLRFPKGAPSRSTLKLEEALLTLLTAEERARWLVPGATAVDLGAAPGGWSWQLVRRHLRVTAVDNGALAPALLDSGLVEHRRADGFKWLPPRPVDWLVCDMVEQPSRVARLAGRWLVEGHARRAIFNLKLPMRKRLEALRADLGALREQLSSRGRPEIRARHLYHDRAEVTVYATIASAARPRRSA